MYSIVEYYSDHEGYRCGYCKKPNTNYSHGMWAHSLTVSDYQDLIDRGWRRSGKYCYKPTMDVICCPMYTIRCRALEFKPSKSQKKVMKRFNKIIGCNEKSSDSEQTGRMSTAGSVGDLQGGEGGGDEFVEAVRPHQDIIISDMKLDTCGEPTPEATPTKTEDKQHAATKTEDQSPDAVVKDERIQISKEVAGPDPNKPPCKKAKQIRRERKLEKLKEKGFTASPLNNTCKNKEKQIEEFINELPDEVKNRLRIKLVRTSPPSDEWTLTSKETFDVYFKYQTVIHKDKPHKCTEPKFKDFLVDSPLLEEYSTSSPDCGYGSFHQQYWLDGKLIAVGVIDILPKCVSSVYFFYDPDYMNLSLGTYGALREIAFTRYLHSRCPQIQYYYMGFYIHSCPKMIYKGKFYPSDLLCPETYKWFPLYDCIPKLEESPYSRLDPDIDNVDENYPTDSDIQNIKMWCGGAVMIYNLYQRKYGMHKKADILSECARLVGGKLAKSLIVVA